MVVGVKVVAEHFAIRIGYRIDDYMIVQVAFVQMGADRTLKETAVQIHSQSRVLGRAWLHRG